jgi:hypothetical protein
VGPAELAYCVVELLGLVELAEGDRTRGSRRASRFGIASSNCVPCPRPAECRILSGAFGWGVSAMITYRSDDSGQANLSALMP